MPAQHSSLLQRLQDRAETGQAGSLQAVIARRRTAAFDISRDIAFKRPSAANTQPAAANASGTGVSTATGVLWLDLDQVEQQWLLAGTADATVAVYNTQGVPKRDAADTPSPSLPLLEPEAVVDRRHSGAHKFLVTCVDWYPVDTGLFVTGSFDEQVKVWDTNTLEVACHFALGAKVYSTAMSPLCGSQCLIAVGSHDTAVKLCDPASGAFAHSLTGHRDKVWSVCWSLQSEFELLTGDASGQMRLWDIRRAGCRYVFDQHSTQRQLLPPARQQPHGGRPAKRRQQQQQQRRESGAGCRDGDPQVYAHEGGITCIHATANGLHYVTGGTDSRVRLWDSYHHHHQLVHYVGTYNRAVRARQLCTTDDGRVLFHPSGSIVQVFDLLSGQPIKELKEGHFESINACAYSPVLQQLYTGANDGSIVAWDASAADARHSAEVEEDAAEFARFSSQPAMAERGADDRDAWSDSSM